MKIRHYNDYNFDSPEQMLYDSRPLTAREFTQFKNTSAVILGVSPDPPESHLKFADKYNLTFTLLADEQKTICTKYGVWQRKSMYGRSYMGVVRTTYLINPAGKIVHRWEKVKVPEHDAEVLKKIAELS